MSSKRQASSDTTAPARAPRVRRSAPSLDSMLFSTPEQKVIRLLLSEPTTALAPRVIASRLKGVRGLGGGEGLMRILAELEDIGLVEFVDNKRAVRIRAEDESPCVGLLKTFSSICDLESLRRLLTPLSSKGILYGSRAQGKSRTGSNYNVYVVSESPDEVLKIAERHPLAKDLALSAATPEAYSELNRTDGTLLRKLEQGVVLWGSTW